MSRAAAGLSTAAGAQQGGGGRGPLLSVAAGAALGSAATWWLGQAGGGAASNSGGQPPAPSPRPRSWLEDAAEGLRDAAAAGGQRFIGAGLATKFCVVIGASLPIVVLCGAAYKVAAPSTPWSIALAKCFTILFRAPPINEPNVAAWTVAYLTFLAGFFAFSLTLSVVGEGVGQQFQSVRAGRYPVRPDPADHFVLLGWNDLAVPLLRQLATQPGAEPGSGWRGSVAVLADKPKEEMDEALRRELGDRGYSLDVHTRRGLPYRPADLRHAAVPSARHVVLLQPEGVVGPAARALGAAAAMSLVALPAEREDQATAHDAASGAEAVLSLAATTGLSAVQRRFRALEMPGSLFVSRITAQAACEPGVLRAWQELLDASPATPQLRTLPGDAAGAATYGEARLRCSELACAIARPDGSVVVSPPDEMPLARGDRLIALTRGSRVGVGSGDGGGKGAGSAAAEAPAPEPLIALRQAAAAAARAREAAARRSGRRAAAGAAKPPRRILVVAWPAAELPTLLEGLVTFGAGSEGGAEITVVTPDTPPPLPPAASAASARRGGSWWRWPWRRGCGGCSVRFVQAAEPLGAAALADAGIATCDVLVVGAASTPAGSPLTAQPPQHGSREAVQQQKQPQQRQPQQKEPEPKGEEGPAADEPPLMRDARLANALLALQHALIASGRESAPEVVAPVSARASAELANEFFRALRAQADRAPVAGDADGGGSAGGGSAGKAPGKGVSGALLRSLDFFQPIDVVASLLCQIALEPAYSELMKELLWTAEGRELYLKPPRLYGVPTGEPITFAELAEAARLRCHTAVGVVTGGRAVLAPAPGEVVTMGEGDRLVVIAED
ncbi:hypothetical protein Rsub_12419 [Raphidocelis subcapitata]|uniref:Uncharacterized protein n=1 Tax=Raphidocelis subcapitata TaxID=307507 RepID=A0A2V0PQC7_9CHLO|nr:hypothetical protein Rsub_12419 [Raphidocelis subcapitata]|eukprot:GBF99707.1 hypothetical protein Rsub_12419 [Raphidocelis subcapitata]